MAELWWLQWILLVWIFCDHQLILLTSSCNFIPSGYCSAGHLHALSGAGLLRRRVHHFCCGLEKGKGLVFLLYSLNLANCKILIVVMLFGAFITGLHDNFILLNCTSWSLIRDYHTFYLIWIISWWSYVKFEDEKLRLCIYFTVAFCFSPSVLRYWSDSMVEI